MKDLKYWERFEKTGNINDYLSYTACTTEDYVMHIEKENREGGHNGDSINCDGNGIISNTHWGL